MRDVYLTDDLDVATARLDDATALNQRCVPTSSREGNSDGGLIEIPCANRQPQRLLESKHREHR